MSAPFAWLAGERSITLGCAVGAQGDRVTPLMPTLHRSLSAAAFVLVASFQLACGSDPGPVNEQPLPGTDAGTEVIPDAGTEDPIVLAPQLGTGELSSVELVEIANSTNGLRRPRDLDFNPRVPDQLWIVNAQDDSMTIISDASKPTRKVTGRRDAASNHFMPVPSSIAFGADNTTIGKPGTFGTCHESRNTYGGQAQPNDFMGPVLWSSDDSVFAVQDPYHLGSHLDMLHGSPNCMGIAHERDNVYWVFGGKAHTLGVPFAQQHLPTPAIVKYDFAHDHGVGEDDHADGEIYQYVTDQVSRVEGVPSHLEFDPATSLLYIADTGNARVAVLDTKSGTKGRALQGQEPLVAYHMMDGATLTTLVETSAQVVLDLPSGIALHDGLLFVSDNSTSWIMAFDLTGKLVKKLDTKLPTGSLAGIKVGPDGKLYLVDMIGNRVLRIDPK